MTRRHLSFACAGESLVGTIDMADEAAIGLLIVTGGNELRSGPFASHAALAAKIAAAGFPVFRFDRRGVGDSSGINATFADSGEDIAAALHAFRTALPGLTRVIAFGNCDAASALMLASGADCAALVLANPWTFEPDPAPAADAPPAVKPAAPAMPAAAIRAHYLRRLLDLSAWKRLLGGKVQVGKLAGSLAAAMAPAAPPSSLAQQIAAGLAEFSGDTTILIAENDRTAQTFLSYWDRSDPRLRKCPGAGHSFAEPHARQWLENQILDALRAAG